MDNPREALEKQDLEAAQRRMGQVAWPTVIFALVVFSAYGATVVLSATDAVSLWLSVPLVAVLSYLSYTVLHEAAHGSISGSHASLRWLNEALGYIAAWVLMLPLTAHRHEHLAHHRNTNKPDEDPDYFVADMLDSPEHTLRTPLKAAYQQYVFYARQRWSKGPRSQDISLSLEVITILLPRLGFLAAGFWLEGIALFLIAWLMGIGLLLYLFAYIVHRPHQNVGRYINTSTILADGHWNRLLTWLWVYQNYHSIHHVFPRVPFYHYRELFEEIEDSMRAKGAPIYRLGWNGLESRGGVPA